VLGHSYEILKKLSPNGLLIGIDRDQEALNAAKSKLKDFSNVKFVKANHDDIRKILDELEIQSVDGILLDLGVSSYQIDEGKRGFSYMKNGDLDMRMDQDGALTARDILNNYSEEKLTEIFFAYGEERNSKRIAKLICEHRVNNEIKTNLELVEIIESVIPFSKDGHPAKRVFQALRIETNNEIKPLYKTVIDSIDCLKSNGRLCIITFHSLEDREVKNAFYDSIGKCTCPKDLPYCICGTIQLGKIITKKPIEASKEELKLNSRALSAKLRIFEKQ